MLTDREEPIDFDGNTYTSVFDLIFNKNPNNVPANTPTFNYRGKVLTFGEVKTAILVCAYNLKEKYGIEKGDVVAVRSLTHYEYPLIIHATVCIGGTIALVKRSPEDDIKMITEDLETVKPKLFIFDYEQRDISLQAAISTGIPKSNMLVLGGGGIIEGISGVQGILLNGNNLAIPYVYNPDEYENHCSYLCYTSGSTGRRKAVIITPRTMINAMKGYITGRCKKDRILANRPINFMSATYSELHVGVFQGSELYFSTATAAEEIYRDIEKYKITHLTAAPHIVNQLAKDITIDKYDLSSLSTVISVGAVITTPIISLVKNRFKTNVVNMYGSCEMFLPLSTTYELTEMGAVGRLTEGYAARIVDGNDNEVEPGMAGEFLIKGPTITKGYYNNPEANAKAFTKDGFYRSGDTLVCDKEGVFWFKSRCKNLMKYHSTHIYPYDIEKIVLAHLKVLDCGVTGIYSEELSTDLPRAFVSLLSKEDCANKEDIAQEILEFTNKRLHETKHIRAGVVILDSIPRNLTGKIMYDDLSSHVQRLQDVNITVDTEAHTNGDDAVKNTLVKKIIGEENNLDNQSYVKDKSDLIFLAKKERRSFMHKIITQ